MVGSALVDSENGPQVFKFLTALLKFTNIALRVLNDGEFDLKALGIEGAESVDIKYGMSDNCDATQGSFEKLGAQPCSCKVHIICNQIQRSYHYHYLTVKYLGIAIKDIYKIVFFQNFSITYFNILVSILIIFNFYS